MASDPQRPLIVRPVLQGLVVRPDLFGAATVGDVAPNRVAATVGR